MIGILGRNYKFTYGARNFVSGLSITASVIKPDGSLLGNYSLTEFSYASMKGIYFFDMVTSDSMEEGEYSVVVVEGTYKNHSKVTMRLSFGGSGNIIQDEKVLGIISASSIVGVVENVRQILVSIPNVNLIGKINLQESLIGKIKDEKITAILNYKSLTGVISCSK